MKLPPVFSCLIFILTSALPIITGFAAPPLVELPACSFVPTEWADGDSFEIQTADGTLQTIRLYGADCIEWHVNDKTDAARLATQRRYFGIAAFGGSTKTSVDAAKSIGQNAAEETARALSRPFTVHTAYADARGDGKHKRVYGFITTSEGEDLAERLVRLGLARAFGVYHQTPSGKSAKDYQENLRDIELLAAKAGSGAWAKTDWTRLSAERQQQRQEDAELNLASESGKLAEGFKIDPNTAARDELMKIPGVGEITANRIIEGRPYKSLSDLANVEGLGPKSLERITPYLLLPEVK